MSAAVSAGSFAALIISEYRPLFGFMGSGYRLAIMLSLLFEGLATLFLVAFVAAAGGKALTRQARPRRRKHPNLSPVFRSAAPAALLRPRDLRQG